jgi:WD40 repeat protein
MTSLSGQTWESLPPDVLERVDAVCERFEAAWKSGTPPTLPEYLAAMPARGRAELLAELLALEREYRRRRDEAPTAEDYARLLPDDATLVRKLWDEAEATPGPGDVPEEGLRPTVPGYEILGELGRGGMGVVYRARHLALNRLVALKMILHAEHAGLKERERFRAEAEAIARLQHPNIVQIYEVGEAGGHPYCALEFVGGGSLAQRLASAPLSPPAAAELVQTLAEAVQAAHERGIIHRDLKPANVLLTDGGLPKITDFGLAKRIEDSSGLTQTGMILGTPSYMAPELAEGRASAVGPATDVYALGAILYECLTGRPPFKGPSAVETLEQVRRQEPAAPRWLNAGVPRDLETVCLKCLRKEPQKRYASSSALAEDLRRWRVGEPIVARPVGALERAAKWARRNPAVAVLLAAVLFSLLLGTSAATFFALRASHSADEARSKADEADREAKRANQEARANKELAEEARFEAARAGNALHANQLRQGLRAWLDNDLGAAEGAMADVEAPFRGTLETRFLRQLCRRRMRFLPRGPAPLASVFDGAASGDCRRFFLAKGWVPRLGAVEVRDAETGRLQLAFKGHNHWVRCIALSADGTRAVSGSHDLTVRVWDASTGQEQCTLRGHARAIMAVAISGDGRWVVSSDSNNVVKLWDASTGKEKRSFPAHPGRVASVAIRRDGKQIVTEGDELKVWDAKTGGEITLRGHTSPIRRVALSGDDRRIVSADEKGIVRVWDAATGKELFVLQGRTGPVKAVAVSGDGKRIVSAGEGGLLEVWDGQTGKEQLSFRGHSGPCNVAVSRDGKRVVSVSPSGDVEIWELDARPERLTLPAPGGPGTQPSACMAVTPDGKRVVSTSGGRGVALTVWDGATGQEKVTRVVSNFLGVVRVAISSDGKCIVTGGMDRLVRVWDGDTGAVRFTLGGHTTRIGAVALRRDGRRAFSGSLDCTVKVWDAQTGKELRTLRGHAKGVQSLAVSGDGKWLVSGDNGGVIIVWDAQTGERKMTLQGHKQVVMCLAISRDDRWFVSGSVSELKIWDLENGQEKRVLKIPALSVSVAISADGKRIVSGSQAGLTFWDVETGLEKLTFPAHPDEVMAVALSDDDGIVTGGDATAKVWDTRTAQEIPTR